MTNKITLPPLPHRALRPGAGDDAMTDYARAAVLLDRQQRAAPTYGSIAERAAAGKDAGLWQAAPSAESVGVAETIMGTAGALTMAAFHAKDVPAGTKLYASPPDHREAMRQALDALTAMTEPQRVASESGRYKLTMSAISALRAALEEK